MYLKSLACLKIEMKWSMICSPRFDETVLLSLHISESKSGIPRCDILNENSAGMLCNTGVKAAIFSQNQSNSTI